MVDLNPLGLWPTLVGLLGWTLAVVVYRARPEGWQNRFAALALAIEPFLISWGVGWMHMLEDPANVYGLVVASVSLTAVFNVAYLGFLSTLETPLARPLHNRAVQIGIGLYGLGHIGAVLANPSAVVLSLAPGGEVPWTVQEGGLVAFGRMATAIVFLYGLAVTISAWRRSPPGNPIRERNRWFAAAFGIRDAGVIAIQLAIVFGIPASSNPQALSTLLDYLLPVPAAIAFLLLSYGILKTQLFDIDLKIKWGLEKSTVAAIFVAVFFAASEAAQVLFADFAGNELIGVAAAALLVFFLAPLQRFADRVSDQAMPDVEDTEAYRQQRKREVYRASLEELHTDEEITPKERRMLGRLQDELGLEGSEASRIEADVVEAGGGGAA